MNLKKYTYSPAWNLLVITVGASLFSLGAKAIVFHNNFITGGIYGTGLLIYYKTHWLSPGIWYFLFNLPLLVIGWFFVSRRFLLYTLYAVLVTTISSELIDFNFGIHEQIYAAVAGGILCGTGGGITLRSLGSGGGLDIIGVILNQKFNLGFGKFYLVFNAVLFSFVITYYNADIFIASIILVFIMSVSLDYMLALFNQRKVIFIVSDKNEEIAGVLVNDLHQGGTFLKGCGVYNRKDKLILMAITNNIQMKRVEETVFNIDPQALFIVENSFNVIGSNFGERKVY